MVLDHPDILHQVILQSDIDINYDASQPQPLRSALVCVGSMLAAGILLVIGQLVIGGGGARFVKYTDKVAGAGNRRVKMKEMLKEGNGIDFSKVRPYGNPNSI